MKVTLRLIDHGHYINRYARIPPTGMLERSLEMTWKKLVQICKDGDMMWHDALKRDIVSVDIVCYDGLTRTYTPEQIYKMEGVNPS